MGEGGDGGANGGRRYNSGGQNEIVFRMPLSVCLMQPMWLELQLNSRVPNRFFFCFQFNISSMIYKGELWNILTGLRLLPFLFTLHFGIS
jgi:hypothetical protein